MDSQVIPFICSETLQGIYASLVAVFLTFLVYLFILVAEKLLGSYGRGVKFIRSCRPLQFISLYK